MKQDWEIKELGEVANFSQGIQVGLEQHLTYPKEGYVRFIRIVDYTQNTDDIRYVPNPGEKYFVNEDDIVMVRYGTPGLIGRGKAGVIANNLFKIKIERKDLTNDYLTLFLSQDYIQNYLSTQGSATMPALNFGQLKTVKIRFPPIQEQQRIVDILDEAFAVIAKAKANAEQNLKNAKELFESYLQGVFDNKDENWEEKRLEEVCIKITDGSHNPPKGIDFSEYLMLSSKNVNNDFIDLNSPRYLKKDDFVSENKRTEVIEGDVLLTIVGTIGRVAVVSIEHKYFTLQRSVAVLKPNKEFILSRFLMYSLQNVHEMLNENARGVAQKGLYLNQIRSLVISIPKLKTQKSIIEKLDYLSVETKKLEAIYQQKINDLEELKKSILQKAFSGELKTNTVAV
jgi:type I restriction enzyme S subunit